MTKDIEKKQDRRHFLKMTTIGTVSLAAGGLIPAYDGMSVVLK
jgi:hypothetical protein